MLLTMLVCMTLAGVGSATPLAEADAATPTAGPSAGCVTRTEFHKVHKRMTKRHVRHIFHARGNREGITIEGGFTSVVRSYHTCTPHGGVWVSSPQGG